MLEDSHTPSCLNISDKKPAANSISGGAKANDLSFDSFSRPDASLPELFDLDQVFGAEFET